MDYNTTTGLPGSHIESYLDCLSRSYSARTGNRENLGSDPQQSFDRNPYALFPFKHCERLWRIGGFGIIKQVEIAV